MSYVPLTYQLRAFSHSAGEAESAWKAQERAVDAGMLQEAVLITGTWQFPLDEAHMGYPSSSLMVPLLLKISSSALGLN